MIVVSEGLTAVKDKRLAGLLGKCRGRFSTPVFNEIAGHVPLPFVEVVFLRDGDDGRVATLLIPRPDNDEFWPGMWHTPGTALRNTDFEREDKNPLNGALERIRGEVGGDFLYPPVFVGNFFVLARRGAGVAAAYYTGFSGERREDNKWYPVEKLVNYHNFIQEQLPFVLAAAEKFKVRRRIE